MKFLNLGCGNAFINNAINIDSEKPKNIPADILFIESKIMEYLFNLRYDTQFEKVYMFCVLEHLSPQDVSHLPWLLNRCMSMGGEVIGSIPDFPTICQQFLDKKITLRRAFFDVMGDKLADTVHQTIWTKDELERYFHTDGFKVVEYSIGKQGTNAFFKIRKVSQITTPIKMLEETEKKEAE